MSLIREKTCPHCKRMLPRSSFSKHAKRADGLQSVCKQCELEYRRKTQRASDLKRNYGLTVEQFEQMLAAQGYGCAICGDRDGLVVDHDHACCEPKHGGKVARACGNCTRGILCQTCNITLGQHGDNVQSLRAAGKIGAVLYLERVA